jgi:hypothetical protein
MITILNMTPCAIKISSFVLSSELAKSIEVVTKDVMIPIKRRTAMMVPDVFVGRLIVGQGIDGKENPVDGLVNTGLVVVLLLGVLCITI